MAVYLYGFIYVLDGSNNEERIMKYTEYRKKLRMLSVKYNDAYKRLGWGADTTRKLRQQKMDLRAKYAVHSFDYAVETLTSKGIL